MTASPFAGSRPPLTVPEVQRLIAGELSLRTRLGYVALLLGSAAMTIVIGALWLTEPSLPSRTQAAFAVMVVIGTSWVVFAAQALARRHVLLARHSVTAGRMAVVFSAVFTVGAMIVGYANGRWAAGFAAGGLGLVMLAVACGLWWKARRELDWLLAERVRLEKELGRRVG